MYNSEEQETSSFPKYFSALLSKMRAETMSRLSQILAQGAKFNPEELRLLIPEDDELYKDYQLFISYPLCYLNGTNTKNFVILVEDEEYVIRFEDYIQKSKKAEHIIREKVIPEHTTPIYTEHEVTRLDEKGNELQSSIKLTKIYSYGSLYDYAFNDFSHEERIKKGLKLFIQMAEILLKIQKSGMFFVDMKSPNWLVDEDELLYVADLKSFMDLLQSGEYNPKNPNEDQKFLRTFVFCPDEMYKVECINVDKAHTGMFGRNLYQFLTVCEANYLMEQNYKWPNIFQYAVGKRLKSLIQSCLIREPELRTTIQMIISELKNILKLQESLEEVMQIVDKLYTTKQTANQEINLLYFFKQQSKKVLKLYDVAAIKSYKDNLFAIIDEYIACQKTVKEIESFMLSYDDKKMEDFIEGCGQHIDSLTTYTEYDNYRTLLQQHLKIIQQSQPIVNNILNVAKTYADKNNPKGQAIYDALYAVPILNRKYILTSNSVECVALRKTIAQNDRRLSIFQFKTKNNPSADDLKKWIDKDLILKASTNYDDEEEENNVPRNN